MRFTRFLAVGVDYFRILDIETDATNEEVKAAYLREAKIWHPDANKAHDAQHRFVLVSEAYENLKNAEGRDAYKFEISPDAVEDWTQSGRKNSKYERARQDYNDVQYEYDAAEKRWKYANNNANARKLKFAKMFERFIHPRILFFVLPIGMLTFYAVSSLTHRAISDVVATESMDLPSPDKSTSLGSSAAAVAGDTQASSSGSTMNANTLEKENPNYIRAWKNPNTNQWETPAPWNPLFKSTEVKLVLRSIVMDSQPPSPGHGHGRMRGKKM